MLTLDQITPYLKYSSIGSIPQQLKHEYYNETLLYKKELQQVFSKKYPDYLDISRPRERKTDKEYRKTVYKNKWTHLPNRIAEALDYIHQADDFGVSFPQPPENLPDDLRYEHYVGKGFTADGNLTEWFFNNCIDNYLLDPNACVSMVLNEIPSKEREYTKTGYFNPKPVVFSSEHVVAHQKGRFAVLVSPEKRIITDKDGKKLEGAVMHFFDDESYVAAFQTGVVQDVYSDSEQFKDDLTWHIVGLKHEVTTGASGEPELSTTFQPILHHFDNMPVYKLGKRRDKVNARREEFYKSTLDAAVEGIKESQEIHSDIQIERKFHVVSTEWRRASAIPKCANPKCVKGKVKVLDKSGAAGGEMDCKMCGGTGTNPSSGSALEMVIVNDEMNAKEIGANAVNEAVRRVGAIPGGYIEKSIQPLIELSKQIKEVDDGVYMNLNMQFIRVAPNTASGDSKRYDREELYRELNTQAAHLLPVLSRLYLQGDNLRYTNFSFHGEQAPEVLIPVRFNLENAELTRDELNDAKDKDYDPSLVVALEKKLLSYEVGTEAAEYQQYLTRLHLDPFRTMNNDERNMIIGLTRTITVEGDKQTNTIKSIFFSVMIDMLMIEAALEYEDFYQMEMKERNDILYKIFEDKYFDGVRKYDPTEIDPATGLPKAMPQTSIRPAVNLQDSKQTVKGNKQQSFMQGK